MPQKQAILFNLHDQHTLMDKIKTRNDFTLKESMKLVAKGQKSSKRVNEHDFQCVHINQWLRLESFME